MKSFLFFALSLISCAPPSAPSPFYLAPFNGQTGVPPELDLVVHTEQLSVPANYPLKAILQVVDLKDGGFVPGDMSYFANTMRFTPKAPWATDRRFAWTLLPVENLTHGPEIHFEDALVGTGVFDTSTRLDFLAGAFIDEATACLLLSRPLGPDDQQNMHVSADGVEITPTFSVLPESEWGPPFELDAADPGPGVICLARSSGDTTPPFSPGLALRIWWGEAGPWHLELQAQTVQSLILQARRGAQ